MSHPVKLSKSTRTRIINTMNDLKTFEQYVRLHLLSLEQDSEELQKEMGFYDDYDSDEYQSLEIEDVSLNGQMIACYHLLRVLDER
jgi:hypothetical protein